MLVFCPALNHITLETATAAAKTAVFFVMETRLTSLWLTVTV